MTACWILALTVGTALTRPVVGRVRVQPQAAAVIGAVLMAVLMIVAGALPPPTAI